MKDRRTRLLAFAVVFLIGLVVVLIRVPERWHGLSIFGAHLATAGIVAILVEVILGDEVLDLLRREIGSPLKLMGVGQQIAASYPERFKSAKEHIDFLGLSFHFGIRAYNKQLLPKIRREHCNIRILILNPDSEVLTLRGQDEPDRNPIRLKEDIGDTLKFFEQLEQEYLKKEHIPLKGSLRVKMHSRMPYFGYTRFDDFCYFSVYSCFEFGYNSPVIGLRDSDPVLFSWLAHHFDTLWEDPSSKLVLDIGSLRGRTSGEQGKKSWLKRLRRKRVAHIPTPAADG